VQSLVWRRRWEQTDNDSFKQKLVTYNAEDCQALRLITEHLEALAAGFDQDGSETPPAGPGDIERVKASKRGTDFRKWGHTAFLLPEFERASRCAWFYYQREKVVARRAGKKPAPPWKGRKKPRQPRPTKRVRVRSNCCPRCKGRNVCEARSPRKVKLFLDLKVSDGGVRRVVIKYTAATYRCRDCGRRFLPRKFMRVRRFGHALKCWIVYLHVANPTSFQSLERTLKECLGLAIRDRELYCFKLELARRYKPTYDGPLKKIVAGNLLHADETGVQFKKDRGYVWAFTSLEEVVYLCRPNREADFLAPLLKGFTGVLVSDFYKGYEALPCAQQKCLVHLVRDLNGDLEKHFHDEAFKGLTKAFAALLGKGVATVDRHGLRREHLQRHKADVDRFYEGACGKLLASEVAEGYRQRFLKYWEKLFTFLDHDGVPWHNNNAEHAIKHFAKYRMGANGKVTARGLQPYLVLLSIYQTCAYKGVSFLRFLLSGERDVDAFKEARRRARAPRWRLLLEAQTVAESTVSDCPASGEANHDEAPAVDNRETDCAEGEPDVDDGMAPVVGRKVPAVIEEIVRRVVAGKDDPRLRWWPGRKRVRVLLNKAFPDRRVRRPALHVALENRLKEAGWIWAHGRVLHTYERCSTAGDCAGESGNRQAPF
jgi:hypothetical protein